jgi:ribosomal RNA methyltransferase Nop2
VRSDEPLRGAPQDFDFDSDEDVEVGSIPSSTRKSKQGKHPTKMVPSYSDEDSSDTDEGGRITMANMEARSRALDETAVAEAELDAQELRQAALELSDNDMDMEGEEAGGELTLPTAAEREEEKNKGGPDVPTVQQRMKYCVRVLGNFKKRAEKGR